MTREELWVPVGELSRRGSMFPTSGRDPRDPCSGLQDVRDHEAVGAEALPQEEEPGAGEERRCPGQGEAHQHRRKGRPALPTTTGGPAAKRKGRWRS